MQGVLPSQGCFWKTTAAGSSSLEASLPWSTKKMLTVQVKDGHEPDNGLEFITNFGWFIACEAWTSTNFDAQKIVWFKWFEAI